MNVILRLWFFYTRSLRVIGPREVSSSDHIITLEITLSVTVLLLSVYFDRDLLLGY